jgi:hypothetical protein
MMIHIKVSLEKEWWTFIIDENEGERRSLDYYERNLSTPEEWAIDLHVLEFELLEHSYLIHFHSASTWIQLNSKGGIFVYCNSSRFSCHYSRFPYNTEHIHCFPVFQQCLTCWEEWLSAWVLTAWATISSEGLRQVDFLRLDHHDSGEDLVPLFTFNLRVFITIFVHNFFEQQKQNNSHSIRRDQRQK